MQKITAKYVHLTNDYTRAVCGTLTKSTTLIFPETVTCPRCLGIMEKQRHLVTGEVAKPSTAEVAQ